MKTGNEKRKPIEWVTKSVYDIAKLLWERGWNYDVWNGDFAIRDIDQAKKYDVSVGWKDLVGRVYVSTVREIPGEDGKPALAAIIPETPIPLARNVIALPTPDQLELEWNERGWTVSLYEHSNKLNVVRDGETITIIAKGNTIEGNEINTKADMYYAVMLTIFDMYLAKEEKKHGTNHNGSDD